MLEDKGSSLAAQLVAALVADQLEAGAGGAAGGVAELAAALQAGAPAYFRDQDRQFFQVSQGPWPGYSTDNSSSQLALLCLNLPILPSDSHPFLQPLGTACCLAESVPHHHSLGDHHVALCTLVLH